MNRHDDVLFTAASALGLLVLLSVLVGCDPGGEGTDTGNALTVEFAVRGSTTAPPQRALGTLTSATMLLNKLEYYDCASVPSWRRPSWSPRRLPSARARAPRSRRASAGS